MMDNTIVTLDLRGTKFRTYKTTFDNLDLSKIRHHKIDRYHYFIDRNPKFFHYILDFASYGESVYGHSYAKLAGVSCNDDEEINFVKETLLYGICHCYVKTNELVSIYHEGCKIHKKQYLAYMNCHIMESPAKRRRPPY